jgi:hypothetical protein
LGGAAPIAPSPPTPQLCRKAAGYDKLIAEPWKSSKAVQDALKKAGAAFQSNRDEAGKEFALDRYAITITQMPPGLTPEELLARFARNPNAVIKSRTFNSLTKFQRRGGGEPRVGTIYDIRIPGVGLGGESNDGSVMLVEKTKDSFTVQTIQVPGQIGRHPVSGARQFGFTRNKDGSVTFYTKGADRPDEDLLRGPGFLAQDAAWKSMMHGLRRQIEKQGGKVEKRTSTLRKDVPLGC